MKLWSEAKVSRADKQFALFCAVFAIFLGLGAGLVFGYEEPATVRFAQERFEASAINQTATAVQQTLAESPGGEAIAPLAFVMLILANNAVIAGILAFNHRFLLPVQSVIITSGALFFNGLIFGAMLIREARAGGVMDAAIAFGSYGLIEIGAYVLAGALGFYALSHGSPHDLERGILFTGVLPLLLIGSMIEIGLLFFV